MSLIRGIDAAMPSPTYDWLFTVIANFVSFLIIVYVFVTSLILHC